MADDKNRSTVDFLNNIPLEGEVFKEAPAEEVEEKEEEKPLSFHKDPKVQRYVQKEIERALKDRPVEREFIREVQEDIKLPSSLVNLVGNDTEEKRKTLKEFADYLESLSDKAQEKVLAKLQEQQEVQVAEDRAAIEELSQGFEEIEDTFSVDLTSNSVQAQKLDNDFRAYIRKIAPKNEQGEVSGFPDLVSAFEEFQDRNKRIQTPSRAKELAFRGLARSTDTSNDTQRGYNWKDVEKHFSKLKE